MSVFDLSDPEIGPNLFEVVNLRNGTDGDDTLPGSPDMDLVTGGAGNDVLIGYAGDDTLDGGAGDDRLFGGRGADVLDGGDGADTAFYRRSWDPVTIDLSGALGIGGQASGDRLLRVENIVGSAWNDSLTGDAADNILRGGHGSDTLDGGGGRDILVGGSGADVLRGGAGRDLASYANSSEGITINLLTGQTLGGDARFDVLVGIEDVRGSRFADGLMGDAGRNVLIGMGGDDFISAGAGNDVLIGGAGGDHLHGSIGFDMASYRGSDAGVIAALDYSRGIGGHAEGDLLDNIEGIVGSDFADVLSGNFLDNRFVGLGGADTLTGGDGVDTFAFRQMQTASQAKFDTGGTLAAAAGLEHDTITDFLSGEDRLRFRSDNFSADRVVMTDVFADLWLADGNDAAFAFNGSSLYHVDFESAADFAADLARVVFIAELTGVTTLSMSDIEFI